MGISTLLLAIAASPVSGQQPVASALKPADAAILSAVIGPGGDVRELRDGRVIASDSGHMKVIDFKKGSVTAILQVPPGNMLAIAADSTIVVTRDGWVFLNGDQPIGMLPATNPVVAAAGYVRSADTIGFVLAVRRRKRDSSDVIRIDRTTGEQEQVVQIYTFPGVPGGVPAPLYQISEHALLAPDGWVAVLRIAPYRVDWRSPSGTWALGEPIPAPTIKFDEREKRAILAYQSTVQLWSPQYSMLPDAWWPATVVHSTGSPRPLITPEGELLVSRTPTADFPGTRYDVVDRQGDVERQIVLPANELIAGFGAHSVYVRVVDHGKVIRLDRHPWP
ncbi:MAG: hypothetical protein ACREK8_08115 [Gemmatimonadales bacterium]